MDGLIFLVVLIPIVFLILLILNLSKSATNQQTLESINNKINQLGNQLHKLEEQIKDLKNEKRTTAPIIEIKEETVQPVIKPEVTTDIPVTPKEEKPVFIPEKKIITPPLIITPAILDEKNITEEDFIPEPIETKYKEPSSPLFKPTHKTDWEKVIGENIANKIGIAVLVLGISFFVKFAIDKNWINEIGRVVIGLLSGGILIALAHYTRNTYRSFSSVLVGGGLTVFYFTIAFAFHQYQLLSQQAAFIIMVIITAFAVMLSIFYNRIELAVLATVGGFITPFLVSTGQNNYISLFTYLCILNSGLLVLSWFKRWKAINIIALFFTVIIYGSWLVKQFWNDEEPFPYYEAFLFATIFYILSITINIINNLKLKSRFGAFDFILLLSINFLYYIAGIIILQHFKDGEYNGLFSASLAGVNLVLAWIFFKQKRIDRNFIYLLIGLTLTFVSLTAPIQLKGNYITLFWAAESVVLFWLYQRSRIHLLKIASLLILFPMLISLFMDWTQIYAGTSVIIPVIINKGFITTLVTSIAILLYYSLILKEADTFYLTGVENKFVRNILLISGIALTFSAGAWEIYYQFITRLPGTYIYATYLQLYSFAFIIILLFLFKKSPSFSLLKFMLTIAGFVLYVFNLSMNYNLSLQMLTTSENSSHYSAHWVSSILLIWLLYDLTRYFRKQTIFKDYAIPFTWITTICLIFLLSIEMFNIIMWTNYNDEKNWIYWRNLYYKAGLSILWGLCSFAMMWLGMKHKFKTLRIISLTLLTVTLVKLFLYDIQNIPPGGKIAAFILLGVLLLIISFMYQRLKKIIIDDQQKEA